MDLISVDIVVDETPLEYIFIISEKGVRNFSDLICNVNGFQQAVLSSLLSFRSSKNATVDGNRARTKRANTDRC